MLSDQQIDQMRLRHRTQGFVHVPGAIPRAMLKRLRAAFDAAAEQRRPQWQRQVACSSADARYFDIPDILDQDDAFVDLVDLPSIFPLMRALVGDDIQLNHTMARVFPPGKTFVEPWHSDIGHMIGVDLAACPSLFLKVHFYLEDLAPNQGCLAFIPGSHRLAADHPRPQFAYSDDCALAVKIVPRAGDVVMFNSHVMHMALDNDSERDRKSIIYVYSHYWVKHYGNAVPRDLDRLATTPQRRQLFGVDEPGVAYLARRLGSDTGGSAVCSHDSLPAAAMRLVKRILPRSPS